MNAQRFVVTDRVWQRLEPHLRRKASDAGATSNGCSRNCQTGGSQAAGRVPCWPKVARQRRERDCCAKLQ